MACVVCANEGNKVNEMHEEKSEIKLTNGEIEVECGFLDSLNSQRNDKLKFELNGEIDEKPSVAPPVSLRDNELPRRGVSSGAIIDENQERIELIPAAANDEADKGIVEQVNSSDSACKGNYDKKDEEDGDFDDKAVDDIIIFEPVVEQILEEKPELIKARDIGEKADQMLKVMDEEKPALSLSIVTLLDDTRAERISEQVAEKTNEVFASKGSNNIEHEFEHEFETLEAACVEQEKLAVKSKETTTRVTRARAHSEQRSGTDSHLASQDISSALRSGSLESMKLFRQQEDVTKGSRPSRLTYSPPANARSPVAHLRREKKPARMLRHTSFDSVCNVLNLFNHINCGILQAVLQLSLTCSFLCPVLSSVDFPCNCLEKMTLSPVHVCLFVVVVVFFLSLGTGKLSSDIINFLEGGGGGRRGRSFNRK